MACLRVNFRGLFKGELYLYLYLYFPSGHFTKIVLEFAASQARTTGAVFDPTNSVINLFRSRGSSGMCQYFFLLASHILECDKVRDMVYIWRIVTINDLWMYAVLLSVVRLSSELL